MSTPITGTCLCGSLTLTISPDATAIKRMTCYCRDCRKNAGGPYQTNAMFNTSDVTLSDPHGRLRTYAITGTMSGQPKDKAFCSECGCTMFTKPGVHKGNKTVVKTGILDNGAMNLFPPVVELFAKDRPDYCRPIEGTKEFETMPGH